jgi:phage terminase large subunit GpA-like protein
MAYRAPEANGKKVLVGSHWHMSFLEAKGVWLVGLDADYWKRWVHDRFMTSLVNEDGTPYRGSLGLFGADDRKHLSYAKHLTAETEVEEFVKGKGLKRLWKKTNRNNHWFDATYMACAAASMNGVELLTRPDPPPRRQTPIQQSQRQPIVSRHLSFRR